MNDKTKKVPVAFIILALVSLAFLGVLIAGCFSPEFFYSITFWVILGAWGVTLIGFLVRRLVLGPHRQSGWGIVSSGMGVRKLEKSGVTGFIAGSLILLGLVAIITAGGWRLMFSLDQDLTLAEGEAQPMPFAEQDSIHLYKFALSFYPQTESQVVRNNESMVEILVDSVDTWDTIRLNQPWRKKGGRIYLVDYGISKDSLYLLCNLITPWDDTIPYEFAPGGVIDDPLFPLVISFEDFYMDRSQLWPTSEVPVVTVSLLLPGELLASKRMRAPDSISAQGYTLHLNGARWRPTTTFRFVRDSSWILALIGACFVLVGLAAGLAVRVKKKMENRDAD